MRKTPLRKCLGCQEMKDKKRLIRVVKTNEGAFSIDKTGKQNGRGAYICSETSCLKKAISNKGLERSFKMQIPEEIYIELMKELDYIGEN
jgi:predicted RNA-binding protein YlxR (DUF448 family)